MKNLGIPRTEVVLMKQHKEWKAAYLDEEKILKRILCETVVDIQHVGSTAIQNINAKPIIDISIGVENKEKLTTVKEKLEQNGYIHRPNHGDENRIFMVKGDEECRTHYLHIQVWKSKSWFNQVFFRNYLNENPSVADEYEKLKNKLFDQYPHDRMKYGQGKDHFIEQVLSKLPEGLTELQKYAVEINVPVNDMLLILLNKNGINADKPSPRIRTTFSMNNCEEKFYLGLANNKNSIFTLVGNNVYYYENNIGKINNLENDDCASSYFRKDKTVITLNSNSRSNCRGCKFCPNNLELNSEDKNLNSYVKLYNHLSNLSGGNLSGIERLTICTGCFGSEDKILEHLLLVYSVAKSLEFKGVFHYIGSEIVSNDAYLLLKKVIGNFMYTFTIECFTNRNNILKNTKAKFTLDDYYNNMKRAINFGFEVNYIYVLGLDDLRAVEMYSKKFSEVSNLFPLINIFQPHTKEHWELLCVETEKTEYYIKIRKMLENIYDNTGLRPNSWECYRPLWYFKFKNEDLKCIRI